MEKFILSLKFIKRIFFRYIIFRKFKNFYLNDKYQISNISLNTNVFFGYFNKRVQCSKGYIVLKIVKNQCHIVLINNNYEEIFLHNCLIYNLQQGVMLHLLDENHIVFNDLNEDNFLVSKIFNIKLSKVVKTFNYPVQNAVYKSDCFYSIDYDLINISRPEYAYGDKINYYENRGIYKINWKSGNVKLICKYDDIFNLNITPTMENSTNWINHVECSPDGNSIVFFHRWISDYGRYTRLISYSNNKIEIINGDIMTSHMSWHNDSQIIAFCSSNICENKYHLFSVKKNKILSVYNELPSNDGHPVRLGDKIITDTYPNEAGFSKLIEFDFTSNKTELIGEFYQPFKFRLHKRIDLHPKFDLNENIIIESGHLGERNLYKVFRK